MEMNRSEREKGAPLPRGYEKAIDSRTIIHITIDPSEIFVMPSREGKGTEYNGERYYSMRSPHGRLKVSQDT
jgi:hypothetical protein